MPSKTEHDGEPASKPKKRVRDLTGALIGVGLMALLTWTSANWYGSVYRTEHVEELCSVFVSNGVAYINGPTLSFARNSARLLPWFQTHTSIVVYADVTFSKRGDRMQTHITKYQAADSSHRDAD